MIHMTDVKLPFANGNHPRTDEEKEQIIENAAKAYEAYMGSCSERLISKENFMIYILLNYFENKC